MTRTGGLMQTDQDDCAQTKQGKGRNDRFQHYVGKGHQLLIELLNAPSLDYVSASKVLGVQPLTKISAADGAYWLGLQ